MKQIFTLIAFVCALSMVAQTSFERNLLVEHFTNTRCGSCAARNPAFFDLIDQYGDDIHHISYHSSVPYSSCAIYQSNTVENEARKDFYNVAFTPSALRNGLNLTSVGNFSSSILDLETMLMSDIGLQVTEGTGDTRSVTIGIVRNAQFEENANLRLFVAATEKLYNFNAPNGETEHHNVFRQFLSDKEGDVFTRPSVGAITELSYSYTLDASWNASEMYIVAWVQDINTKEIFNSATTFSGQVVSTKNIDAAEVGLTLSPNPAYSDIVIEWDNAYSFQEVEIRNLTGNLVRKQNVKVDGQTVLSVADLPKGVYFAIVIGERGFASQQFSVVK